MAELWVRKPVIAWWKASAENGERRTDRTLAGALHLGINTVSRYINRTVCVPYPTAKLLAETMGLPFDQVIETRDTDGTTVDALLAPAPAPAPAAEPPRREVDAA